MYIGGSTGSRSAKPLNDANPEIPSTSVPNPGRRRYGPLCPQPEMRTTTSFGLRARSVAGASPIFSSVSGRKLSTKTSAFSTNFSSRSLASGLRSSSATLFLLRA